MRDSIFATDLSVVVIQQNRKQFNTTANVQKLWHRICSEIMAPPVFRDYDIAGCFYRSPCGAIVSEHLWWC